MNIAILQRELDEIENSQNLFDALNFRARKEALDFVAVIDRIDTENYMDNPKGGRLEQQARALAKKLQAFNSSIAEDWHLRLRNEKPTPQVLRKWLQPYSDYLPHQWGQPYYGYENLDFLLDEILLPQPHPQASLPLQEGMVRYESTPASVILELTERIAFTGDDVFYDLGSGLGKVTLLVHLLTGARSIGVEFQPDFCTYASKKANDLKLNGVTYLNADARHVDYADATVFFFFNPFGGDIFPAVLERLQLEMQERDIWVSSYGTSSQPLSELPWLERIPPISENESALAIFRGRS
ncbi:MAG: class I SAM-dependent methyltransferase [Anaerolineae bacterium]|jgi:hypothetical protein|nr:class I SAM-dependent methyltransferase [Anaerolineae bacterium]MBT4311139.1 class I SAM-dependent methyltransferase [Anaerolineae bacterium]MBT4457587.1 class I SAM-dependent methyltransferase [Anaerolineae bacterium]MBT4841754.1 class I SAM-dependent methyltransferase [Anaerolineae bacterium]MBT6059626.1 class I SAM-dependent methyltransferase [Anaerolineae bacterium]